MSAALYHICMRYVLEKRALGEFAKLTARQNSYVLVAFARAIGEDLPIARLHRRHIEKWLIGLQVAESTKRSRLSIVRSFCRWCVDHDHLKRDPTRGIRGPNEGQTVPRGFTPQEVAALLKVVPDERAVVTVLLGVGCGLRCSEIVTLSTSDVDWDDRSILVHGKGRKERLVPFDDEVEEALDRYLAVHPAGPHVPLIRSYQNPGLGICAVHLGRLVSAWMRDAGIKRRPWDGKSLHALRHTAAIDVFDASKDLIAVKDLLGHEHVSTTNRYLKQRVDLGRVRDASAGRRYFTAQE